MLIDKLPRAWPRGAPESAEVVLSSDEEKALDKLRCMLAWLQKWAAYSHRARQRGMRTYLPWKMCTALV